MLVYKFHIITDRALLTSRGWINYVWIESCVLRSNEREAGESSNSCDGFDEHLDGMKRAGVDGKVPKDSIDVLGRK